ncbi:polysaccharide deacetylase family protein [Pseudomarimonas arenosa]|uniref:Polysaccharide deacetylase family protein n=1 Tax=Pseudomarimonas arenosa TaxID=2774145 RepID=A0AAW3ZI89_9GAMM|nr:polysaccharide deacetylase family protein [Pseudomarimonas arenosa]MBD8524847.1 polysaccharide deacetylase family protein [Pseudomarimonas arenosa]
MTSTAHDQGSPLQGDLVLMYHAIEGPAAAPAGADPHYTVSGERFAAQLDWMVAQGLRVCSARDGLLIKSAEPQVWIGFDDGDASNYDNALPILSERGLTADFFINSANVGQPGFVSWAQLREMVAAGMSIQSHGHTHTYFTAHDAVQLSAELRRSKAEIEDKLGIEVSLLAPPGGRCPPRLLELAEQCGYRWVLGSAPGRLLRGGRGILPRVAVTSQHQVTHLAGWLQPQSRSLAKLRLRYQLLAAAKRVLGDRRYEQWRGRLLGGAM